MARAKLSTRIEAQEGAPFPEVLDRYTPERCASPEEIAAALGCSVQALMREAEPHGFEVVRIIRRKRAHAVKL